MFWIILINVKDLNEFEIATFANTADYIKVYTPTNDYIKVYSNQFSQTLTLKSGGTILDTNNKKLSPTEVRALLKNNTELYKHLSYCIIEKSESMRAVEKKYLFEKFKCD